MNDNKFMLAGDGWVQVTPCGEFPHAGAGVVQVIDRAACDAMAAEFNDRKADANFPGVLVDFDHFSLDTGQSSEAAGWITELESRDTGLWARVRWSDAGLAAVQGGRFRLMSPVFPPPSACEDLGGGRIRPRALVSVALTNEPNIRGGRPLANRQTDRSLVHDCGGALVVGNRGGAKKYRWVLGNPPSGEHCEVCLDRAGQVKTAAEWDKMKAPPCNCHCMLEPVDEATANRWSDEARAASLAVRRAKAAARRADPAAPGGTYPDGTPVIRDLAAGLGGHEPGQTTISDAGELEERQRRYEEALRAWWDGVETTSDNIEAFNAYVASFAGAAAAGKGARSPAGAATRTFGASSGGSSSKGASGRRGLLGSLKKGLRQFDKAFETDPVRERARRAEVSRRADAERLERSMLEKAIRDLSVKTGGATGGGLDRLADALGLNPKPERLGLADLRKLLTELSGSPNTVKYVQEETAKEWARMEAARRERSRGDLPNRWSDAARAAALEVRRAKASARAKPSAMPPSLMPPRDPGRDNPFNPPAKQLFGKVMAGAVFMVGGVPCKVVDGVLEPQAGPALPKAPARAGRTAARPPVPYELLKLLKDAGVDLGKIRGLLSAAR